MIWKAPWGSHIDLDRIVSVEFKDSLNPTFQIYFQLMDNPIRVLIDFDRHFDLISEYGMQGVYNKWHAELIYEWQRHKILQSN